MMPNLSSMKCVAIHHTIYTYTWGDEQSSGVIYLKLSIYLDRMPFLIRLNLPCSLTKLAKWDKVDYTEYLPW